MLTPHLSIFINPFQLSRNGHTVPNGPVNGAVVGNEAMNMHGRIHPIVSRNFQIDTKPNRLHRQIGPA
jgi:hypothetical protein